MLKIFLILDLVLIVVLQQPDDSNETGGLINVTNSSNFDFLQTSVRKYVKDCRFFSVESQSNGTKSSNLTDDSDIVNQKYLKACLNEQKKISNGIVSKVDSKSSMDSNEIACVSQCIFNRMEVIDETGIPSETAFLDWIENNQQNYKESLVLSDKVSKCFAKLTNFDIDDGCTSSQKLFECLDLKT